MIKQIKPKCASNFILLPCPITSNDDEHIGGQVTSQPHVLAGPTFYPYTMCSHPGCRHQRTQRLMRLVLGHEVAHSAVIVLMGSGVLLVA